MHRAVYFNAKRYNLHDIFYSFPKILFIFILNFLQKFDSYFDKFYEKFTRNSLKNSKNSINLFTLNSP